MKILDINQKQGEITVKTENLYDLWTLYNVINEDDEVTALTQRRVVLKEGTKGERKVMRLKLKVKDISFHEFSNRLRIKGTILEGPEDYVSYGTYHTFNIEIPQKLTIFKENWLKHELKRLKETSRFESNFIILIIAIETGLATIALITNFSYNRIATIKKNIPGKRYKQTYRNKALEEFFSDIQKVLVENIKNINVDLLIFCGPGNTKDNFIKFLRETPNFTFKGNIETCHASSGTESAIRETLKSKKLANLKSKIKVLQEAEKIENIMTLFANDADLIVIGLDEVSSASEQGAVKQLLIADVLIRGASKKKKLKIEEIITNVENSGGEINIMSTENITGEQLVDLGSIIGILRYKL
ncbi:MAG: mRNA surveillance protein pelota [Promethearchaeota archaeon]|nr:MAG: mRNA surveillance protein pelota [Candidatus Lokiarchaeota archaeon]